MKLYKEKWEEKEKLNLENDIMLRLESYVLDKKYKELFEALDNAELEKQVEEPIKEHIIYKKSYCINDFKADYHSYKGNAYGLANTLRQTAILKPKLNNKKLKNLIYAGQLTVPGPGVPPALISGKLAANELITYFKK